MGIKVTNNAYGTLSASITSSATTIALATGQGARFPSLSAGDYFYGTLIDTSNNVEIVKVTARSTDSMTVVRAQDNTTARAYSTNDRFELRPTAALFDDIQANKLNKAGDTVTGVFKVEAGTEYNPVIVTSTSTNTFPRVFEGYSPNTANDSNGATMILGKAGTARNAGHISFIKRSTAGKESLSFGVYNSDNLMHINGDGHFTLPWQPAFRAYAGSNTNYSTSDTKITVHDQTSFNVGNFYNTSNQRFTAPIAGIYIFTARAWAAQGNTGAAGICFKKNGGTVGTMRMGSSPAEYSTLQPMTYLSLAAGDYVELFTEACSTSGVVHTSSGETNSMFAGYLLG